MAVSTALADRIQNYVPVKEIQVIGNLINTEIFSPGKNEKPQVPFIFTIAAHLDLNKNVGKSAARFFIRHLQVMKVSI